MRYEHDSYLTPSGSGGILVLTPRARPEVSDVGSLQDQSRHRKSVSGHFLLTSLFLTYPSYFLVPCSAFVIRKPSGIRIDIDNLFPDTPFSLPCSLLFLLTSLFGIRYSLFFLLLALEYKAACVVCIFSGGSDFIDACGQ